MIDSTDKVLMLHSIVADCVRAVTDPNDDSFADELNIELGHAVKRLIKIKTQPGTHAFRAKASAVRKYVRMMECDENGEMLDDVGLTMRAVWSLLNDMGGH